MRGSKFSISPSTNMMDVLGHSGYSFDYAIADLIDNSISANAKNIKIYIDIEDKNPFIYILDDGDGMNINDLKHAAILGYKDLDGKRKDNDLGRYSTGLKSATRSFADNVIICSKTLNGKFGAIQIDYKHIKKSNKWEAFEIKKLSQFKLIEKKGTLVYCDNLKIVGKDFDKNNLYDKLQQLEDSLSHIFGKYILSGKINIEIQTSQSTKSKIVIKGWNPFDLIENKSTKLIYQKRLDYKSSIINIKSYIIPVFNNLSIVDQEYVKGKGLVDQQGFYVYRNDRLIQEGGWLGLKGLSFDDKCKYARIEVDISHELDEEFKVNFSKNSITVPDDLIDTFIEVAKQARKESKNNFNYLRDPSLKPKKKTDEEKVWRIVNSTKGKVLSINEEHPLIKQFCEEMSSNNRKKLLSILSKTLPITTIQTQDTNVELYSAQEINLLIKDMYERLKQENHSLEEIKRKMIVIEPFKSFKDELVEFFGNLEE